MEYINGVLKISVRRKFYHLSEVDEIMFNGACWQITSKRDVPVIAKNKIKTLLKNKWIEFKEKRQTNFSEVDIYRVMQTNDSKIKIGQKIYILGLGWGKEDKCYKKEIINGEVMVFCSCGGKREEQSVLNNSNNYMFSSKDEINKKLSTSYMSKML